MKAKKPQLLTRRIRSLGRKLRKTVWHKNYMQIAWVVEDPFKREILWDTLRTFTDMWPIRR